MNQLQVILFTVVPCILMISSVLFYPTDAQLDCSKRMLKFTLKCSYMFRFNKHHQGAIIRTLLKLKILVCGADVIIFILD